MRQRVVLPDQRVADIDITSCAVRRIEAEFAESFGPDVGTAVAQAFVAAVAGHHREIEAAGAKPRTLN
jgi:hypothetical protein